MKKLSLLLSASFFLFLTMGCDLSGESANDLIAEAEDAYAASTESATTSGATTTSTDTATSSSSTAGFLWKPVSESNGNLVVLLPSSTQGRTQQVCTISGAFGSESAPMRHETHNGGRPHFYFGKPGGSYGTNITVQAPLTDGSIFSTVVADGSARTEK
ncbi:hypothetical protein P0Y35_10485 [Kiritimatiellaeota bacterium B1221]|nr:hypothetical protein [Kiritimatiellaeota bacterium B1221]